MNVLKWDCETGRVLSRGEYLGPGEDHVDYVAEAGGPQVARTLCDVVVISRIPIKHSLRVHE